MSTLFEVQALGLLHVQDFAQYYQTPFGPSSLTPTPDDDYDTWCWLRLHVNRRCGGARTIFLLVQKSTWNGSTTTTCEAETAVRSRHL